MSGEAELYGVTARAYLRRCGDRLRDGTKEGLFYAAFELRCCVEARLAEYMEHYEPYKDLKVQLFRIGENAKKVKQISEGKVIAQVVMGFGTADQISQFHTPVPETLKLYIERHIDALRHAQRIYREPNDPWWEEVREGLLGAYRQAWVACRGEMPVPPLWDTETGRTHPLVFNVDKWNAHVLDSSVFKPGQQFIFKVEYLEEPPADWVCDL